MTAKEYLEKNCINYPDAIKKVIDDLYPIRSDSKATGEYYRNNLVKDLGINGAETGNSDIAAALLSLEKYHCKPENIKKITDDLKEYFSKEKPAHIPTFKEELLNVIKEDKSFGYLFYLLQSEQNRINGTNVDCIPNEHEIDLYINWHDWDYFYNTDNIRNQKLVEEIEQYFTKQDGKDHFEPLYFFNLLLQQNEFIRDNLYKAKTVIDRLTQLPYSEQQKHILFGFLMKYNYGGYPIGTAFSGYHIESKLSGQLNTVFRLIEKEFLKYPEKTPEKTVCMRDYWAENQEELDDLFIYGASPGYILQTRADKYKKETEKLKNELRSAEKAKKDAEEKMDKLDKELQHLQENETGKLKSNVRLSNKKGMKIDYIRVINCLYELGFFTDENKNAGTKTDVFKVFGMAVNENLSTFNQMLTSTERASNRDLASVKRIFEIMLAKQVKILDAKDQKT